MKMRDITSGISRSGLMVGGMLDSKLHTRLCTTEAFAMPSVVRLPLHRQGRPVPYAKPASQLIGLAMSRSVSAGSAQAVSHKAPAPLPLVRSRSQPSPEDLPINAPSLPDVATGTTMQGTSLSKSTSVTLSEWMGDLTFESQGTPHFKDTIADTSQDASPRCSQTRSQSEAMVSAALEILQVGAHAVSAQVGGSEEEAHCLYRSELYTLFGLFDGHGGAEASRFCRDQLHTHVMGSAHFGNNGDVGTRAALLEGFLLTERKLLASQEVALNHKPLCASLVGSSALLFVLQSGGRSMNIAWAGDSKAVLCRGGSVVELTRDHRTSDTRERARVLREGGRVLDGRLAGCLDVSRSLGDFDEALRQKLRGLSARPDLLSEALLPEDEFVILGSAGLWAALPPAEAVKIARDELRAYDDAPLVAKKLVGVARQRRADHNATAIVVRLFPRRGALWDEPSTVPRKCGFVTVPTSPNFVRVVGGFGKPARSALGGASPWPASTSW